jgi:2-dehydropantoate 2-reductase
LKIAILGAGALGCAIGGVLNEGGHDVWLISRNQAQVIAIQQHGLKLREAGVDRVLKVKATSTPQEAGVVDLVIVLVKSYHTAEAMLGATSLLGPSTVVLSMQNGLGHEDVLAAIVGRDRVLAGKTYAGGTQLGVGHVLIGIKSKETFIGELGGGISARVQNLATVFSAAGLETQCSANIMGTIWDKLFVNVATGALSGITGLPYGKLYSVPELEACAVAAVAEAMAVAKACGIAVSTNDPRQPWLKAGAGLPSEFKASMLQSLEKGMVTEVDYINGAVVAQGHKCGVPTPVNQTLVACIKGIERGLT